MADFGFDALAFEGDDAAGQAHPFEIARDLISTGKPRAALELLSLHRAAFADDPEYLLICSEAWVQDGDALRAQQALLGAARLAPNDPMPLLMLGDLLAAQGERDKAKRVLDKARALGAEQQGPLAEATKPSDDLIAFAEQQERRMQAGLTPRQILIGAIALLAIGSLVLGIAVITGPEADEPLEAPPETRIDPEARGGEVDESAPDDVISEAPTELPGPERESIDVDIVPLVQLAEVVPTAPLIWAAPPADALNEPKEAKPLKRATRTRVARRKPAPERATPAAPSAATVSNELASLDPEQLTERADALYLEGHRAVSASYYRRALDLDPDYAPALVGIGRSVLRAEKYSEAFDNATRALQLARGVDSRPGLEAEAIYQLARVHLHRGEIDASRRLLRQSISLPGTPPSAWFYLGEALWNDNSPAAREAYEKYLELVSDGHLADRARRAIR